MKREFTFQSPLRVKIKKIKKMKKRKSLGDRNILPFSQALHLKQHLAIPNFFFFLLFFLDTKHSSAIVNKFTYKSDLYHNRNSLGGGRLAWGVRVLSFKSSTLLLTGFVLSRPKFGSLAALCT